MNDGVVIAPVTEEHTYEIQAAYFNYDIAKGVIVGRDEVRGRFKRRPYRGGQCADLFEWIEVKIGRAYGVGEQIAAQSDESYVFDYVSQLDRAAVERQLPVKEWRDLPFAEGFNYVFDFEAQFDKFPIDFSSIARDPDGWFFYVNVLDAHNQYDILRTKRYGKADQLLAPGDSVVRDHSEHFDLEDWSPFMRCQFDKASRVNVTTWLGAGICMGREANVLYYRCDDVLIVMNILPVDAISRGMTNYHGHIYVARGSQLLLAGDLFEYLPLTSGYQHREVHLKLLE